MANKILELLKDLTDNDTLIIIFLFTLALLNTDVNLINTVIAGFIGYIGGKSTK